jgi:hypothetical protein
MARSMILVMIRGFLVSLLLSGTILAQTPTPSAPAHFRWSEHLAHELDYKHTIATAKELSPEERAEMLAFVLNRFKHPVGTHDAEMFEDISNRKMLKLAGDTRIESVNLDGDGATEIIAQGNGLGPCGATGNCVLMVLQSTPAGWKVLLDTRAGKDGHGVEKIRLMDTVTNGFHDIVLASHVSATERDLEVFRFSAGKYRRSACYYARVEEGRSPYDISSYRCSGDK